MKNWSKVTKKALAATAVAAAFAAASFSASAQEFQDFIVDEGSIPGNTAVTFEADKINGAYSERITFGPGGSFVTSAYANFGIFLENQGTVQVTESTLGAEYGLYALFTSSGTVSGGPGVFTFSGSDAEVRVFIDPENDTDFALGATGADPVILGDNADDYLIASADELVSGTGVLVTGVGGFFDIVLDGFTLTVDGEEYFISPDPFYIRVNIDGDFDNFTPVGNQTLTGDVSAVFLIPEPGSLALLGFGLLGLALGLRRRLA